ncbi:MAG: nucleotide exchange factor GrpE [Sumerlaeia bacterium]
MSEQQTPEATPDETTPKNTNEAEVVLEEEVLEDSGVDGVLTDELPEAPAAPDNWQDKYIRLAAEFENFRKRTRKEAAQNRLRERELVVSGFLDILDNLERAFEIPGAQDNAWLEGMKGVHKQFQTTLNSLGVSEIEALSLPYNPHLHEALSTAPNPDLENEIVLHVIQKGYILNNDLILRPAKVIVVRNQ